ncbi:MAG: hydrogenase maturation nickel metallochaperone HypA [Thermoleophilia bacterium]|nr:hydrogenase maturation nickel metallochaperone HypA [Thermoleophilia bacterium]
MHEYAITESILEIVQAEATRAGAARVDEITLVVGELTTFVDQSIEFYFTELARGTAAEGARLRFQRIEAKAHCSACGADFRPHNAFFTCPQCRSAVFELRQGQELFIESIEVSQQDKPNPEGD